MSRWKNWLSGMLAASMLLAVYAPVSNAATESQQSQTVQPGLAAPVPTSDPILAQSYADVPDQAWYAKSVNGWIALGILRPKQGDSFEPGLAMTRGDFAYLLAYSLGLAPSSNITAFKDLPDAGQARYIAALQEAGLVSGFPDGTFRPSSPVTRAEAVSWIAAAKKLKPESPSSSRFRDVAPDNWYAGAVNALTEAGIVSGKSKALFDPNDSLNRAEAVVLLDHSFYSPSLIQDIRDDGSILIDGQVYIADDSVKGIFQASNKAILHNAAIQFASSGNTITSVESLMIGYKGALAGNGQTLVFNADGDTINGFVTVDADQVALANLNVQGDLLLGRGFQSHLILSNVHVNGETVYFEDADRPKTQIADLAIQNSDLGTMVLGNSVNLDQADHDPIELSQLDTAAHKEVRLLAYTAPSDESNIPPEASKLPPDPSKLPGVNPDLPQSVINLPTTNVSLPSSVPPTLPPGLHLQVADGAIIVTNGGGSQGFQAGQFGYVPSMAQPPIIVPSNPGISFVPPPSFNTGGSNGGSSGGQAKNPIQVNCISLICNIEAYANSLIDTGPTGKIDTAIVHDGSDMRYTGSSPIDTLVLGDSNATGGASFTGSANIGQVVANNKGGPITLNSQGNIGTLELTGESPVDLPGSATIGNLIIPPGSEPNSLITDPDDLSNVWTINGNPMPNFCGVHPSDSRCRIVVSPPSTPVVEPSVSNVTYRVTNVEDFTVEFTATVANAFKLYYVIVNDAPAAPTAAEIRSGTFSYQINGGSLDVSNGVQPAFSVTLPSGMYYTIYMVAESGGRLSGVLAKELHAGPPPAPVIYDEGYGELSETTYDHAVSASWEDNMDTTSTATLSKDGGDAEPYTKGTPISANGSYVLTVTSLDPNGLTSSTTVSFTVAVAEPLES